MDPGFERSLGHRRALVETLHRDHHLHSPRVAAGLLAVPREAFVPGLDLDDVYRPSDAIVVKRVEGMSVSSASAPEVIALMLEQLDPRPGDHVLEIGAGTGYNAALLAHMVGPSGQVVTMDIDEDLVEAARLHLEAAGYGQVIVVQSDGALGYPAARAYDRIILTVSSSDIAPAWHAQLARPHGRLVMPLSLRGLQRCVCFTLGADDCLRSRSLRTCSFISVRGLLATESPGLSDGTLLQRDTAELLPLVPESIGEVLDRPMRAWSSGVSSNADEVRQGMHLWLVAHEPRVYMLWGGDQVPDLFDLAERVPGARGTLCLYDPPTQGLALLTWADATAHAGDVCALAPPGGEPVAMRLVTLVTEWAQAGRPLDADVEIRACPRSTSSPAGEGEVAVDRRWTRFLLSWPRGPHPPTSFTV
jgi:protein-L-isoaspartate(D-aspartate) O-methyltransferase